MPFQPPAHGRVFTLHGRLWRANTLHHAIQRACTRAGVPPIRTHDLRHAHATYMLATGAASLYELMTRCGWRSFSVLEKYAAISEKYRCQTWLPKWSQGAHTGQQADTQRKRQSTARAVTTGMSRQK